MAGLISNLLLLTIQYSILDCTRRTLRSVYKPYGPQMCRQLCQDFTDTIYFLQIDLSCHRISANNNVDSLKNCQVNKMEASWINNRKAFALGLGFDVCSNHEGTYRPRLTVESSHLDQVSNNISLHQACEGGRLCVVQSILSHRPTELNNRDKLGRTPVMAAAIGRQVTVFDFLVSQNCDLMAVDINNDTVLHVACDSGSVDIVRRLVVNHTYDIERRGRTGRTPVMRAALHGHREVFEFLVSKGCNLTLLDSKMNNILHVACCGGHVDMVKYVLAKLEFDKESRGERGRTPVLISAHRGHSDLVSFLESSNCNMSAVDVYKDNILHVACIGGHEDMVRYILQKTPIDIESRAKHGHTPSMRATYYGQLAVVKFLVSRGANLTAVDDNMNTMLHVACSGGNVSMVQYILSQIQISFDIKGHYGRSPVMSAARYGHKTVVKYLVSEGCNLTVSDDIGNNILHMACMSGNVGVVKYILAQLKFGIEDRGEYGRTPVMFAGYYGHLEVVKFLVNQGCNLSILDSLGDNIHHIAASSGNVHLVKYIFLQTAVGKESRAANGRTPVMIAACEGHMAIVKYLDSMGCNLLTQDSTGNNILHLGCMSGNVEMVKYILSNTKINMESKGCYKSTPVMIAVYKGRVALVKYLVSKGCDLSIHDYVGNSILHVACSGGNLDMVKYILSKTKIRIESIGHFGQTPVMAAVRRGHMAVVRYLVKRRCKLYMEDSQGYSILHTACMSRNVNMVKYILYKTKIPLERKGHYGRTPVMTAADFGRVAAFKYLASKGSKLFKHDSLHNTILHLASLSGSVEIVEYVMSQTKLGIDSRGQGGRTPVMCAAYKGHTSVFEFLVGKGCELTKTDFRRNNVLHVACEGGHVEMVKRILSKRKIAIDSRQNSGLTPVMIATHHGFTSVVKYLVGEDCNLSVVEERGKNIFQVACQAHHYDLVKYLLTLRSWSKTDRCE